MSAEESAVKPETGAPATTDDMVTLKVVNQRGETTVFRIKRATKMERLMKAYCDRAQITPSAVRFLVNGERVNPDKTPAELKFEDEDTIDVVLMQTGGANE